LKGGSHLATYNAILEVSTSLRKLIWNNIKGTELGNLVGENGITFNHPTDKNDSTTKLSIFLFRIGENSFHRNLPPVYDDVNRYRLPITLDLYYMFTPHNKPSSDSILMDQKLMGRVIQIFNENPVLRVPDLEDTISDEEIKIFNYDMPIEEISKIWGGLLENNPYMLSVFYEVTPVRIDSDMKIVTKRTAKIILDEKTNGGVPFNV
jgi:hypothetical protein